MIRETLGAAFLKYAAIVVGLAIGTAAKYGLALTDGKRLNWKSVLADFLLLGMLGLLAIVIADWLHLAGNARVLAGALAAVSSDRLIRLVRNRFEAIAGQRVDQLARVASTADFAKVPAGHDMPDAVRAEIVQPYREPIGSSLRSSYRHMTKRRPPEDQIALLRELDPEQE